MARKKPTQEEKMARGVKKYGLLPFKTAQQIHARRELRSILKDESIQAKEQIADVRWAQRPNQCDYPGVDSVNPPPGNNPERNERFQATVKAERQKAQAKAQKAQEKMEKKRDRDANRFGRKLEAAKKQSRAAEKMGDRIKAAAAREHTASMKVSELAKREEILQQKIANAKTLRAQARLKKQLRHAEGTKLQTLARYKLLADQVNQMKRQHAKMPFAEKHHWEAK